jgi:hypothetical protein
VTELGDMLITSDHHCALNRGGLLLVPTEELDGVALLEGEITPKILAEHGEMRFLAWSELSQIVALVEQYGPTLAAYQQEQDAYFTQVAQVWLDGFAKEAEALCKRGCYWWPEIRNEAHHALLRLKFEVKNEVICAWDASALQSRDFPRAQQEELLMRYFKRLYYERYPVPVREEEREKEE